VEVFVITERPWVTGGLISAATTVVIFGLLVVTHPRDAGSVSDPPSSLVVAAAPATPTAAPVSPTAAPAAKASPKAAAKPKATTAKAKLKPKATATKKAKKAGTAAKPGAGGSGNGRIQFGRTYSGRATFYGATGAGNCSFDASSDLMVAAMNQQDYDNSQACGAHVSVKGPNGTVAVRIVDRCPECPPGAIDLSQQAFAKIAAVSAGRVPITWRLLSPSVSAPVSYRYKSGSSQYWCAIQVLNHRNPVRSMQLKVGGTWRTLDRQEYNYFLSAGGSGCGGAIRITDIYGNQLTDSGIRVAPDAVQRGNAQFPAR
jgi:expansin (peptidoglycan-binding protein)